MHDVSFDEALEFIQLIDSRYHREAYVFVREALDHTQEHLKRNTRDCAHHVTGQELLAGIKDFGLQKFGPMALMVLEEWGIKSCPDFGEIVFNLVELGGSPAFSADDFKQLDALAARLRKHSEPVSQFLWQALAEATRVAIAAGKSDELLADMLAADLNRIIVSGPLYEAPRFAHLSLSRGAKCLIGQKVKGAHLARFNRLLLEDAYPVELAKSHGVLAKTEQDSRADFEEGYDFHEAFQKPFLPRSKQANQAENAPAPSSV
jgi:uncharacterized repeat protein (TIGR04138 family)